MSGEDVGAGLLEQIRSRCELLMTVWLLFCLQDSDGDKSDDLVVDVSNEVRVAPAVWAPLMGWGMVGYVLLSEQWSLCSRRIREAGRQGGPLVRDGCLWGC